MSYELGEDVLVDFNGKEHPGEVIKYEKGWVTATIAVDPLWDYGSITPRLTPRSTVCVPERRVRRPEQ